VALTPRTVIDAPVITPHPYGLYSVARVTEDGDNGSRGERWEAGGVEFSSVACAQGTVWAVGCGPAFTVTLTKTATANQWSANMTPDIGPYEVSINGGAYTAILDLGVFVTNSAGSTVVIRESTGLRRRVSFTGVSNVATTGATLTGTSSNQAYNDAKTGDGKVWQVGDPFGVIAGTACGSLGTLGIDDEARARAALAGAEQRLVEGVFERGTIAPHLAAGAGVVTPAGVSAVKVKRAIGSLEAYLRSEYNGVGVLHMSPLLAEYVAPTVKGNQLVTKLGTPIAFGAGYDGVSPAGATPAAGTLWIYATGAVMVRKSPVLRPAEGAETLDRATNQILMIVERSIVVAVDCVPIAAALVDLAGEDA
jgi:hypothetical protein